MKKIVNYILIISVSLISTAEHCRNPLKCYTNAIPLLKEGNEEMKNN
jgi:hypothetical protein